MSEQGAPTNVYCAFADIALAFIQVRTALQREGLQIESADVGFADPHQMEFDDDDQCIFQGPSVTLRVGLRVDQTPELVLTVSFMPPLIGLPAKATIGLIYKAVTGRWYVEVHEDRDFVADDFEQLPTYRRLKQRNLFQDDTDHHLSSDHVFRQIAALVSVMAEDKRQAAKISAPGDE